jgi:hypothetical protein
MTNNLFKWLSWPFFLQKFFEGAIGALGAIFIYGFVIWLVYNQYINNTTLTEAIKIRTGNLISLS